MEKGTNTKTVENLKGYVEKSVNGFGYSPEFLRVIGIDGKTNFNCEEQAKLSDTVEKYQKLNFVEFQDNQTFPIAQRQRIREINKVLKNTDEPIEEKIKEKLKTELLEISKADKKVTGNNFAQLLKCEKFQFDYNHISKTLILSAIYVDKENVETLLKVELPFIGVEIAQENLSWKYVGKSALNDLKYQNKLFAFRIKEDHLELIDEKQRVVIADFGVPVMSKNKSKKVIAKLKAEREELLKLLESGNAKKALELLRA